MAVLAVFFQHLGDAHLPFVRSRVAGALPEAVVPWVMTVLHHAHWGVDLFFVLSGFSLAQPILGRAYRAVEQPQGDPRSPADSVARGDSGQGHSGGGAAIFGPPLGGLLHSAEAEPRKAGRSPEPSRSDRGDPLSFRAWGESFFLRRAARLYPAYLAALLLVIASVPAVRQHPSFGASLAAHLALIQGYWLPSGLAIIGAAWSLTTEVTFYAVWPLLAPRILSGPQGPGGATGPLAGGATGPSADRVTGTLVRRATPWLAGLLVVAFVWKLRSALHDVALAPSAPPGLLEATQRRWAVCRLDQFVLGALGASLHARLMRSPRRAALLRAAPLLVVAAAISLVPAFYLEGALYPEPGGAWPYALVSLSTGALVFASASVPERAATWMFPAPLRWVGVVSYGVFLHHQLALGATARLAGAPGTWGAFATHAIPALALSLLLGWISWVAVERPAIEWASRKAAARRRESGTELRPR